MSFDKTVIDFRTKLEYHEYLKNHLHELLSAKCKDFEFVKEYPKGESHGIDIVGVRKILGKEREIIAIEVLGIAEERVKKGAQLSSGQVQKIMTDISKLLLRSKAPVKILVFSTVETRDHMEKARKANIKKGYLNWADIEFYEINEFIGKF
jgi:hypothetical protein